MPLAVQTNLQYSVITHEDGSFTLVYGDGVQEIELHAHGNSVTLSHPYEDAPYNYDGPKEFGDLGAALLAVEALLEWLGHP